MNGEQEGGKSNCRWLEDVDHCVSAVVFLYHSSLYTDEPPDFIVVADWCTLQFFHNMYIPLLYC